MLRIPATVSGRDASLVFRDSLLTVSDTATAASTDHPFTSIKSVHTKNSSDTFLMKLKLDNSSLILEFFSSHVRDLVKAILHHRAISAESLQKNLLDRNIEAKKFNQNIQSLSHFHGKERLTDSILRNTSLIVGTDLYTQTEYSDLLSSDFVPSLTQPLVDLFLSMHYSLNQFYNLFVSSYFYDPKNSKSPIDRLLSERIRGFASDVDYASRINSYGFMALSDLTVPPMVIKEPKSKPLDDMEPACPLLPDDTHERTLSKPTAQYRLIMRSLTCTFEPGIIPERIRFRFESKDFELARDLCRLAYLKEPEILREAPTFTAEFREMLRGHYGEDSLRYVERLCPTFYM